MKRTPLLCLPAIAAAAIMWPATCAAETYYVNNRIGHNAYDGLSDRPVSLFSGPVRSIHRALELAGPADIIVVANTGLPYYEQISLTGARHSGYPQAPFTILGNEAVVSGARAVPPEAWKELQSGLWSFTPWRKGHYQLIRDGKAVPEVRAARGTPELPTLPAGHWTAWRGSIYYRPQAGEIPSEEPFAFAVETTGLTLYQVRNVVIRNLTFRHFRVDGVSAHSLCDNVVLENVRVGGNGRAGLFVGGTSDVEALDCQFGGNRLHHVLIRGRFAVLRSTPPLGEPPTFAD